MSVRICVATGNLRGIASKPISIIQVTIVHVKMLIYEIERVVYKNNKLTVYAFTKPGEGM